MKFTFRRIKALAALIFLLLVVVSCRQKPAPAAAFPPVDVKVYRYEQALFKINPDHLKEELKPLNKDYHFFLGNTELDDNSLMQMKGYLTDPMIKDLFKKVNEVYPDVQELEKGLSKSFTIYKGLFPEVKLPKVYTYVSGLDIEIPVRLADSVMIIALDDYLGRDSKYYKNLGVPLFKAYSFNKEFIVPDCMKRLGYRLMKDNKKAVNLLDWMIYEGKLLYFLDVTLQESPDDVKIAYTPDQIKWCKTHESDIWAYFISNKLLFTPDSKAILQLMGEAPFTKGFARESPGRVGAWTGWQIVRAYMNQNPGITLKQLMADGDSQKILSQSKYKPGK